MADDRLSPDDAHILNLESAAITGHTLKLVILEPGPPLDVDALRSAVAARLPNQPRATERVDTSGTDARWVEATDFDIDDHVRSRIDGSAATREDLWRIVSGLMSEHLDRRHPLWTFDVIGPLADGREAIAARIHHAMCDGIAAVRFLDTVLFDAQSLTPAGAGRIGVHAAPPAHSRRDEARRMPGAVVRELGHPSARSPFDRPITVSRELAFTDVPLAGLKEIGASRPTRATVNDVLLTVVGGGLRTWLERHEGLQRHLRAQVPVSLHHRDEDAADLGNRDSFMNVDLPLGVRDPLTMLDLISAQTRERKRLDDADEMYDLLHALGAVKYVGKAAKRLTNSPREFSLSISNVPGPPSVVEVSGRRVANLFSSSEPAAHHALRISAISCAGAIGIGLCTDPQALPHIAKMAEAVEAAYFELRSAATQ
ncbi:MULTISPECIES: wax ester/triacylglycerol synthase domain-containing protein [unclassified Mycobacterium]|uniref:wax ester/triacylglycerol synthase domain-containing protein n=1 Tax=unclassified Mycobacterium TaxID=2642494 RepID=UPI0029C60CDF|nr:MULTISPECIES: wax ester/triacylglycerol synthase domain-containing protein [unclassified Mycobacterium]